MKSFHKLKVWKSSHDLTLSIYEYSRAFPSDEFYGLKSQIRRSAASIPCNIAEGCGRGSDRDFARFVQIALGSASELEYQLLLCRDLGYIKASAFDELSDSVSSIKKMLSGLLKRLRSTR